MAGDKGKKRSRKKRSRTDMKGVEDGDSNEYQSAQKKSKDKKDVDLGHGNGDQSEIMKSKSQPLLCVGTSCNLSDSVWKTCSSYGQAAAQNVFEIKLELLTAFGTDSDELDVKNPLLAFSHGFEDGDMWQNLKQFLLEMFCHPDKSTVDSDYIYAFTRIGGKFQLCIYKIKSMPDSLQGGHIQLSRMNVSFSLKPVEIRSQNAVNNFLEGKPKIKQGIDLINLTPVSAYLDKSHMDTIPHSVQNLNIDCVMLPAPPDSSEWDGFNTTISEFFQRYKAFDHKLLLGQEDLHAVHIKAPRSLVSRVGETIESKAYSFEKITVDHVRFRGKTSLAILGAKLIPYTDHHARRNLNEIGEIMMDQLAWLGLEKEDLPPDLKSILEILIDKFTEPSYALKNYILVKNSIVWMDGRERGFAIEELYGDFLYVLKPKEQIIAAKNFPNWKDWHEKIKANWLLDDCRTFGFPPDMKSKNATNEFHAKRRRKLLPGVENNEDTARRLYNFQQRFKNIRNPFHHLPESAEKMKLAEPLSRVDIDHIVSSCFAAEYVEAQKEVPRVLALRNEADPDYERFDCYFPAVKFGPGDQKTVMEKRD